jgi:HPt (histidine-containing phosphotransfer) domain-containing protein
VPTQIFDREAALARVGDDEELLAELVKIFLDDYPSNLREIESALHAGNPNQLERAAHTLKGAVANFGAEAVVQEAFALECLGRKGDLSHANESLQRLCQVLQVLDHEIRPLAC